MSQRREPCAPTKCLQHHWPAVSASLRPLRQAVCVFAERCGVCDEPAVALAVGEAATNTAVHAYTGSAPGEIRVEAHCEADHLRVVIADSGCGMRPRIDSPGLGLGLPLIARLTDSFDVQTPAAGGTEVSMRFARAR